MQVCPEDMGTFGNIISPFLRFIVKYFLIRIHLTRRYSCFDLLAAQILFLLFHQYSIISTMLKCRVADFHYMFFCLEKLQVIPKFSHDFTAFES